MEEINKYFYETYYLPLIIPFIQLLLSLFCLKNFQNLGELRTFTIYFISGFIQSTISIILFLSLANSTTYSFLLNISIYLFIIIEFWVFEIYFIKITKKSIVLKTNKVMIALFVGICINQLVNYNFAKFDFRLLFVSEAIIVLTSCSLYLYEIFNPFHEEDLRDNPSFWLTTGCLFFFTTTIPINLFYDVNHFGSNEIRKLFIIIYITYILLFFMIFKSIKCRLKKTI